MLARLAARRREIAVRLSLGASRFRVLRQLFTESLLLAVAGGLTGLLISRWAAQALSFVAYNPPGGIALDWRVMTYTLGISVFTAVVVGLTPAWQTTRFDLIPALKQEGIGFNLRAPRFHLRGALVVGQIALSLVLLLGAGLFVRTLLSIVNLDPGFETKNLSVAQFRFNSPGSSEYDVARAAQFQRELQERLLATPPVKGAVWVDHAPLMDNPFDPDPGDASYHLDDGSASIGKVNGATVITAKTPPNRATSNAVAPNYFAALGVPLLSGRTFTEEDTRDNRAVVIGVALGLLISAVATRALAAALFGVSPTDPGAFVVVTLLLGLVALLACWIPARRATKVDPLVALRCE